MTTAPVSATLIITDERCFSMWLNKYDIRSSPYPPSFRRTAAKIIDPAMGASTCAFGSHRCVVNIGNFTRNPPRVISHAIDTAGKSVGKVIDINIGMWVVFEHIKILHKATSIGREAVTV